MQQRVAHAGSCHDPEWVAERIGPRIRARRLELGLTLRELARRIDVSASFVSLVETGRCPPSVDTLCALTTELGISADELLAEPT
jgi:transcriptional regulator with XRE-family HTH domain